MRETAQELCVWGRHIRAAVRAGEGTPLVLCNGIGAGLDLLQPFVDAGDPAIPVVRFDIPGLGGSELPRCPYNSATMAHSLGRLLDKLGYDEADVLGVSGGGPHRGQRPDLHRRPVPGRACLTSFANLTDDGDWRSRMEKEG